MSEKLSATIEVGLDGSKVQDGVAPIARTLENLGKTAKKAGRDAGEGLGSVGEETSKATAKVDSATKNLVSSTERAIARLKAELEGGSKSHSKFLEVLATQRGVNMDVLNPYLVKLKEIEKAQADAASKAQGIASLSAANAPMDKEAAAKKLTEQILAQGTTSQWKGEGQGSAEKNAADMAKILADTGITDIKQFGKVTTQVEGAVQPVYSNDGETVTGYVDSKGNKVDPNSVKVSTQYSGGDAGQAENVYTALVNQETFGNKTTGQAVADTYGERQKDNAFGGTYTGEGNTGYRVQFDAQGNPIFYTTKASSSDVGDLAPILAIASFIPALAPFAQAINAAIAIDRGDILGGIASLAGVAGMSDVSTGLKVVKALDEGNIMGVVTSLLADPSLGKLASTTMIADGISFADAGNTLKIVDNLNKGNLTGAYNTAMGRLALFSNTTASNNTAVGYQALYSQTNPAGTNTAFGYQAGFGVTTGYDNLLLGDGAGYVSTALTTGTGNICIGTSTRTSSATATNQINIGYGVTGQANANVTLGSFSGKIYNAYTVNATWTQTSDARLKTSVQDDSLGLSFINRLRTVKFNWKPSNEIDQTLPYYNEINQRDTETVIHGLIAQEVKAALDAEGVTTFAGWDEGSDGIQAISREMFVSPLIKAIQELSAQVETLKSEIATLKGA